jgi:membrane protein required for colicin V production
MALTLLDFILLGIMAVSGILALMRGFTREALSLVAWGLAALAAYFASQRPELTAFVLPYLDKPLFAQVAVGLGVFILVLIIASIISVRISDLVIDSAAGAIDRTLGFVYGLGRGLVLVSIAYLFYGWLQPLERQEDWVKSAQSFSIVQSTSNFLRGLMPPDIAETLANSAAPTAPLDGGTETTPAPEQPIGNNDQQGLNNLSNDATAPEPGAEAPEQPAAPAAPANGATQP